MDYVILAINILFSAYYILLALRAFLPWVPQNRMIWWARLISGLTDPLLNPIRLGLPPEKIGMDVSPFVGIILAWLLQHFIINYLLGG